MNELDLVMAWLASLAGGADCGICNAINNSFDDLLNLGIGVAGAAGAAAGTVMGTASRVYDRARQFPGDAAQAAGESFGRNYSQAIGGSDSGATPAPSPQAHGQFPPVSGTPQAHGQFPPVSGTPQVQGPFGPVPAPPPPNPWTRAFSGQGQNPNAPMSGGSLNYFNVGGPTGSQLGGQQ